MKPLPDPQQQQVVPPSVTRPKRRLIPFAMLVGLVWGVTATFGFVWIDHAETETGLARLQTAGDVEAVWTQSLDQFLERGDSQQETHSGGYFRPIYCLSLTLDWLIGDGASQWFHVSNLLWQTIVAWLLYRLGCRLFESERHGEAIAFWGAALFSVHPMCIQSVAWISGRKDLLCAAFGLIALNLFAASLREPLVDDDNPIRTPLWRRALPVCFAPVFLAMALFSKELAFVVPAVATAWWWFRPGEIAIAAPQVRLGDVGGDHPHEIKTQLSPYRGLLCVVLLWATAAVVMWYRIRVTGGLGLGESYPADSIQGNAAITLSLVARYLLVSVFPFNGTIVDRWHVGDPGPAAIASAVLVLVFALLALAAFVRRRSTRSFTWVWFAIWLLPATGIVPLRHLYAERYLYPALWGLCAGAMHWLLHRLPPNPKAAGHIQKRAIAGVVAIIFGAIAFDQTKHWRTDKDLFSHALEQNPQYVEGGIGLASHHMGEREYGRAIELIDAAIVSAADEEYHSYHSPFISYSNLGLAHYYQRNLVEAKNAFDEALRARPANAISHYHLGLTAMTAGRINAAETHFKDALKCSPGHYLSLSNLAYTYLLQERFQDSVDAFEPLIVAVPDDARNRGNLATAYLMNGDYADAEFQFRVLTRSNSDPVLQAKLAWAEYRLGRTTSALTNIREAAIKNPKHPTVSYVAQMILKTEARSRKPTSVPSPPKFVPVDGKPAAETSGDQPEEQQ